MTVHLFSSVPMGEDPARCPVDSFGAVRGVRGLRVNDASLLPGPPGVNPQGTVMAIAARNVSAFLAAGGGRGG
jgi:choline dehydrogenase-like flavoprotein